MTKVFNDKNVRYELADLIKGSKKPLHKAKAVVIQLPSNEKYVYLKKRSMHTDIPLSSYEEYTVTQDYTHHFNEVQGKYIILDKDSLNMRGQELLNKM